MVIIATFNEPAKARQLKRRFQDAGIKSDVHNEAPVQQFGFMSKPQANAKVMVDDVDFEKAQSLMIEWESTDPEISAALIRCPQCNSSNIEYPQMTRKFVTPALVAVLCAMKIIPKEFYCQDCHFTWSNQEEPTIGAALAPVFPRRGNELVSCQKSGGGCGEANSDKEDARRSTLNTQRSPVDSELN